MRITWKNALLLAVLLPFGALHLAAQDTESPEKDGDNFSLEAALESFKGASSLEDFEKKLNAEENDINNLDLNDDGETDYIRVEDHSEGGVHAIVLQAVISESESQDIAVIEIEKTGDENAVLQIVGDIELYGDAAIAEPFEEEVAPKTGRGGPVPGVQPLAVVVNVWLWTPVRHIYRPGYVVYASPWRWRAYPTWYRPYRPRAYSVFRVHARPYRSHYRVVTTRRVVRAHAVYAPHRKQSKVVHTRKTTRVVKGKNGNVKASRTKTTTTVKKGNNKAAPARKGGGQGQKNQHPNGRQKRGG